MRKKIYKNGATLIYQKERKKYTHVTAGFFFGKNRDNYSEPTAHFCEHMLFKSTTQKDYKTLSNEINNTFSYLDAVTSQVYIKLIFQRANEAISPCFKLASEMLLKTKFLPKEIKGEKGVIKQELIRGNANYNTQFAFATIRTLRDNHNSSTSTLGNEEEIENINSNALKKFRDEVFISENFIIVIIGGISYRKAKKLTEKNFINKLKSNHEYPVDKIIDFPVNRPGNMNVEYFNFQKVIGRISFKIDIDINNIKTIEILNMCNIIFNNINGKLFKLLRDNGLVYFTSFSSYYHKDYQMINIDFETSNENVNKIFDKIAIFIKELKENNLDNDLIISAKKNEKLMKHESETNLNIDANNIVYTFLELGEKKLSKSIERKHKKAFKNITSEDIKEFFKTNISNPENIYITILTGEKNPQYYSYEKIQKMFTK